MDLLKAAISTLWWPFAAGAAFGAVCYGLSALATRRQR